MLLVIGYTVDFTADEGALTCGKPGQEIEGTIVSLTIKSWRKMSSLSSLAIYMKETTCFIQK
jgi:hypothetical protein